MLRRYLLVPVLIGVLTGVSAVVFVHLLNLITRYVLESVVSYIQPLPAGEGIRQEFTQEPTRPYLLPLTVALGGLISGFLTYYLSPESAGVGTDAAIKAYHNRERLSIRSSILKLITSALTIGTGGTSGREGPIALIGAGIGSTVAGLFRMGERDRRIAIAVGLGSGIAAIFKAPLAGAIISAEVFFKRDFDIEAVIPSFIASITSYSVFALFFGFQPIFSVNIQKLSNIYPTLLAYAGLGVVCALMVRIFIFVFFMVKERFDRLSFPPYLKPALGGFLAGLVGMFVPSAIGNGYGWLQLIMDGKLHDITLILFSALGIILGASLTLGSGGSGGVFGPSVMLGGLVGAFYSLFLNSMHNLSLHVPSMVVVGMISFFAGAAKAPLSTLILIAEMTGGYELLIPAMISVFITFFLSGDRSIFPSQVDTRLDSPAYSDEWGLYIIERLRVKDHMSEPITIKPYVHIEEAQDLMAQNLIGGLPVVNDGKLVGIITKSDVLKVPPEKRSSTKVYEVMSTNLIVATPEDTLGYVFRLMMGKGVGRIPIVEKKGSLKLVGIIARADIGRAIREHKA
ncbi:Cl- channel voltage-gated family protein [Hydrogenobacter thermophilus TK-6]|uniref:Putative chloride channel n=1 Tax=Hydrogenobacter thermophilus (strain DSM 6534 / IAM 12695 / TK-6) TaxID=608538 RepID=D3DK90_HYDTT|nr:chloride channel protein [Hydrogenobacter thermophilus]ADO46161.1 Cl- channel voltage-gated family protein [Hydrogenobacter thermophilus TK-6]BAI70242.1 putative chloride channel [Hydrogenobacter thermophilus TK-6]